MNEPMRTKTLNNMGWMFKGPDPALGAFLKHVERSKGYFADIGAAFGNATLKALQLGGHVLAIDLEQRHLDVLLNDCPRVDRSRLETRCGHFPNTIELPENTFDGILLSRVLIFLTADEIDRALLKIYNALKLNGTLYLSTPSYLRKKWLSLLPIHERQKAAGLPWPGYIENLWEIIPEMQTILPNAIQLVDEVSLCQGLDNAGFTIQECDYTPKEDTPDEDAFNLCYAIASK